jgi:hypothetical protein
MLNITGIIRLRDQATYVRTTTDTIQIHCAIGFHIIQRIIFTAGRCAFNPDLLRGFLFLGTGEYQLVGAEVSEYRRSTMQAVGRGVLA